MKIKDLKSGEVVSRKHTDGSIWGKCKGLTISNIRGKLFYQTNGVIESKVRSNSSAYSYNDFYFSDIYGNKLTIQEVPQMKYEETKVVVLREQGGTLVPFKSDDDAQQWIAKELDRDSTQKFTVWTTPSYEVRPKKVDLSDLIHKF